MGLTRLEQNAKSLGERVNFGSEIRQLLGQVATETGKEKIQILCDNAYNFFKQEITRLDNSLKANKSVRGAMQSSAQTNWAIVGRISVSAKETRTRLSENSETFLRNVQIFGRGFPNLADGINVRESAFSRDNHVQLENFRTCLQKVLSIEKIN